MPTDWLSVADVTDLADLKVATIHTYMYLSKTPPPDDRIRRSPAWRPETIQEWLRGHAASSQTSRDECAC